MIQLFSSPLPPVRTSEVERYAGFGKSHIDAEKLDRLASEALPRIEGRVCYEIVPCQVSGDLVSFPCFQLVSCSLSALLVHSSQCIFFAATLGLGLDRLIARMTPVSPSDAWLVHAIGTERIEALCDAFEDHMRAQGFCLTSRFSPGYGDIPLTVQQDLFRLLDCPRKIGLTLSETCLMSPAKSVTGFIGLGGGHRQSGCDQCHQKDCLFRHSV